MPNRRKFLEKVSWAGGLILLGKFPFTSFAANKTIKLTILHTNDTLSQIEPFPADASKNAGLGGVQARANWIQEIRAQEENVILVDAGDFFFNSSHFEVFRGAVEIEAMNQMKYDAACLGEHEFDDGIENLSTQLSKAKWKTLCCNYIFENKDLREQIKPFTIIEKSNLKIGILAVGINLEGLIDDEIRKQIKFQNPIEKANEIAKYLKKNEKCDFIICLSHLGLYNNNEPKFSDKNLAKESENIDLIIGGHSHTLLPKPLKYYNLKKQEILVVQSGWGGSHLGRIDYIFSTDKNILSSNVQTVEIGK